jgi:hypothetical protein
MVQSRKVAAGANGVARKAGCEGLARDGRRQSVAREKSGLPEEMEGTETWSDACCGALAFVRAAGHANTRHESVESRHSADDGVAASVAVGCRVGFGLVAPINDM